MNHRFSQSYKDQVVENPMPVVFSGGVFSDLFRWEQPSLLGLSKGLAKQMVEEGRDSWEIEITGGPLIERPTDPNYNYADLVDSRWPASIAAIQYYTSRDTIQYVGHSNGCRVALSSLEKYQTTGKSNVAKVQNLQTGNYVTVNLQGSSSTPVVDTFVGTGCPGAFQGDSRFIRRSIAAGDQAIANHQANQRLHLSARDHARLVDPALVPFLENGLISMSLLDFYNDIAISTTDKFDLSNLTIRNLTLIAGDFENIFFQISLPYGNDNDFIVPMNDSINIANSIQSNDKRVIVYNTKHPNLPDDPSVKETIKGRLRR